MTAFSNSPDLLQKILLHKQQEVATRQRIISQQDYQAQIETLPPPRDFVGAIKVKQAQHQVAIIAEIKRASPSQGLIRADFNPAWIAAAYQAAGATCLSVLTDEHFFQGSIGALQAARLNCHLPILRKDFIVDPYQIYESRAVGADCILLIVAALTDGQLKEFAELARALNLAVLVEVHTLEELKRACDLPVTLLGINNRNLKTFKTDLTTTISLLPEVPHNKIVITESGIETRADIETMQKNGVNVFLIGETFMRAVDPGKKLAELIGVVKSGA